MKHIINLFKRAIGLIRTKGLKGAFAIIKEMDNQMDIPGFFDYIMDDEKIIFENNEREELLNGKDTIINWVIPEMGIGSGGHINIFRFVQKLQDMGFKNRVYIFKSNALDSDQAFISFIDQYYNLDTKNIELHYDVAGMKPAHAIIATSWQTAYFVRKFDKVISKFYFVQDFEPYFFAVGSEYTFAENTYKFGLRGITAGDWLKDKLRDEYGMKTESFSFSYDKDVYHALDKKDDKKRIFFYARPVTPRRAFELGLLALTDIAKKIPDVEVVFAGWDVSGYKIPFAHKSVGSAKVEELSEIYSQCDMCLILSNTNLSLLPLEVMASNSVAVCTKGPNSTWLVNDENSIMVDFDPIAISDTLCYYLQNREELARIRKRGLEFALATSWDDEAKKVRDAILRGIEEDGKN